MNIDDGGNIWEDPQNIEEGGIVTWGWAVDSDEDGERMVWTDLMGFWFLLFFF